MTGNFLFDLVEFMLVFGFLLFAHEFGHYIMARIFGIEVEVSYWAFQEFEGQGLGTDICKELVRLALMHLSLIHI